MFGRVGVELVLGPVGQGVELDLAVVALFNHAQAQTVAALEALAAGDPGGEVAKRRIERDHLADVAAQVGVGLPKVGLGVVNRQVLEGGPQVAHVRQAVPRGQGLAVVQGLAEQHAGVEEQHRRVRVDPGQHVQQYGRLRAERRDHGDAARIGLQRGAQDLLRRCGAQARVQGRGGDRRRLTLEALTVVGHVHAPNCAPVRSAKAGVCPSAAVW